MSAPSPIRRRRLYQDVLERLVQRIRSGEIGRGEQLPSERELMAFYGVGRPAVREALQALERQGLVSISHGERARVVEPTADGLIRQVAEGARHLLDANADNLDNLKDARLFIEAGLAQRAAACASADDIETLRQCVVALERSLDHLEDFLAKDIAFHRQIAAMAGNPIFPAMVEAMLQWLSAYYHQMVRLPGAENLTIAEHRRILAAIEAHDSDAAGIAMSEHLTRANALYRQYE